MRRKRTYPAFALAGCLAAWAGHDAQAESMTFPALESRGSRLELGAVSAPIVGVVPTVVPGRARFARCPADSEVSGTVCMDKFEASVWRVPNPLTVNRWLVRKIQHGMATLADLAAGGATQLGESVTDDYAPCSDSGQNCADDIYAVSVAGVLPSANITWFQAQAACTNAHKRLPSNAEWQAAVMGTPDPGPDDGVNDCNTLNELAPTATGSRSRCVSSFRVFDMVGNLSEWVADWLPRPTVCGAWPEALSPTGDAQCLSGAAEDGEPGVMMRGGDFNTGTFGGPLSVVPTRPSFSHDVVGFRCAH